MMQKSRINEVASEDSTTLEDVIGLLRKDSLLSQPDRDEAIRNIRTACKWFGFEPGDVIAHPMNIRPRFNRLSPGGLGVSRKRIQNVRASVKRSLQRVKIINGRSFKVPLTEEWNQLLRAITDQYRMKKVRCLASYASATGVQAHEVDDAFADRLHDALLADRLHREPRIAHQCAIRAWNQLVAEMPGWPQQRLAPVFYRKKKSLDVCYHPELQAAIDAFLHRNATSDPFDLSAPILPWKASTVETYGRYLKRYVGLLVQTGHAPKDLRRLSDLAAIDRLVPALKLMMEQNGGNSRTGASHIARLVAQVAAEALRTEHLSEEQIAILKQDRIKMRELADRLHKRVKELGAENRKRLQPLRDHANLARLFILPFAVARDVAAVGEPSRKDALLMQWALALMILTFCPLRVSSLCGLRLDRHINWSRPGMQGELRLAFAFRELKGDAPEVLPLPKECAALMRTYIQRYRPVLGAPECPFLFPGRYADRAKLRTVMSGQLQKLIHNRTGFAVNPHLYRHIVHLVVLSRFPGAHAMVSRVLTHRSLKTARQNYAYFDVELSMKAYQDLIRSVQEGRPHSGRSHDIAYGIDQEDMRNG